MIAFMGALQPPWVVSFVLRRRNTYLEELPVRFPGHVFTVMSFHDVKSGSGIFPKVVSLGIFFL